MTIEADGATGSEFALKRTGRASGRHGGLQPFIEASLTRLLRLQQISSKEPALIAAVDGPIEIARLALPNRPHACSAFLSGRDQASPNSLIEISSPLRPADVRDSTTRPWQLRGCYVEIAGLPAAFG
jgi:hypothetical protein